MSYDNAERDEFFDKWDNWEDSKPIGEQIKWYAEHIERAKISLLKAHFLSKKIIVAMEAGLLNEDEEQRFNKALLATITTRDMLNDFLPPDKVARVVK
jgi:hypothetical protein